MSDLEKNFAVHEAICAQRYESIDKSLREGDCVCCLAQALLVNSLRSF